MHTYMHTHGRGGEGKGREEKREREYIHNNIRKLHLVINYLHLAYAAVNLYAFQFRN